MEPVKTSQLYRLRVPGRLIDADGPAKLLRGNPQDIKSNLLHLFQAAVRVNRLAVELDSLEADFLLQWIDAWTRPLWLAQIKDRSAGFVLLQPDLSPLLQRTSGGRWPWWRVWLRLAAKRHAQAGRILFGGVLHEAQGRGLGTQLLAKSLHTAQKLGWESLTIVPIPGNRPAGRFLSQRGAQPRQTYQYFEWP